MRESGKEESSPEKYGGEEDGGGWEEEEELPGEDWGDHEWGNEWRGTTSYENFQISDDAEWWAWEETWDAGKGFAPDGGEAARVSRRDPLLSPRRKGGQKGAVRTQQRPGADAADPDASDDASPTTLHYGKGGKSGKQQKGAGAVRETKEPGHSEESSGRDAGWRASEASDWGDHPSSEWDHPSEPSVEYRAENFLRNQPAPGRQGKFRVQSASKGAGKSSKSSKSSPRPPHGKTRVIEDIPRGREDIPPVTLLKADVSLSPMTRPRGWSSSAGWGKQEFHERGRGEFASKAGLEEAVQQRVDSEPDAKREAGVPRKGKQGGVFGEWDGATHKGKKRKKFSPGSSGKVPRPASEPRRLQGFVADASPIWGSLDPWEQEESKSESSFLWFHQHRTHCILHLHEPIDTSFVCPHICLAHDRTHEAVSPRT